MKNIINVLDNTALGVILGMLLGWAMMFCIIGISYEAFGVTLDISMEIVHGVCYVFGLIGSVLCNIFKVIS